ncbi:hypothetical protein QP028_10120 [Corynebacterium suedekumii]|nr:hypothetical protein QP028_10120 [Corynebacterium suedekumii]
MVELAPAGQQLFSIGLELALLGEVLGVPPPIGLLEHVAAPLLGDLGLVPVIEAFEHHVHPRL